MKRKPIVFSQSLHAFTLVELLTAIGIIAVLLVMASAGMASMRDRARAVECISNLRLLGLGIQRYTLDYQGLLPIRSKPVSGATAQQWHREVWLSLRNEGDPKDWGAARDNAAKSGYKKWPFYCPADRDPLTTLQGLSYAVNIQLTDTRSTLARGKQVLLMELKNRYMMSGRTTEISNDITRRHGASNHILFADYHLEYLKADEIPTLENAPDAWKVSP